MIKRFNHRKGGHTESTQILKSMLCCDIEIIVVFVD